MIPLNMMCYSKFLETDSRMVLPGAVGGERNGELLFNEHRVWDVQDAKSSGDWWHRDVNVFNTYWMYTYPWLREQLRKQEGHLWLLLPEWLANDHVAPGTDGCILSTCQSPHPWGQIKKWRGWWHSWSLASNEAETRTCWDLGANVDDIAFVFID